MKTAHSRFRSPLASRRSLLQAGWVAASALVMPACSKKESAPAAPGGEPAGDVTLTGSGASFPAPIYSRWFQEFSKQQDHIRVNYQATGSGAGIRAFVEGQTDFGGSDAAMSDEELQQAGFPILMLPVTAGGVVLAYNLEGVAGLQLSRQNYVDIFLGKITHWSDPKLKQDNPGLTLPDRKITVVRRSDGSGTTYVFTKHLSAVSEAWKNGPGTGKSPNWPVGVGGRKNDGVAGLVKQTPGAIGYVEYGFAAATKLTTVALQNQSGKFVKPGLQAAANALATVELPTDMRAWVSDPSGESAYPIVTYTWILARKSYADPNKAQAVKKLLDYCLTEGQKLSAELHYVPLPAAVASKVRKAAAGITAS